MKLTLLTAHVGLPFGFIGEEDKKDYCRKHGYKFVCETDRFEDTRPLSWSKILFVQDHLADCDWLFWSDADSLITNHSIKLETLIDNDYDFIVCRDWLNINMGQFLIRNSPWSWDFLKAMWDQEGYINHHWWEQGATIALLQDEKYSSRTKIVSNKMFNAYPAPGFSWPERDSKWEPGDFLVHFPGSEQTALEAWGKPKMRLMEEWFYKRV